MILALLLRFWKPLALVLLIGGALGYVTYLRYAASVAEARAVAAETRASVAETRAAMDRTVSELGVAREIVIRTLPAVPVVATRLRQLCDQPAVRTSDTPSLVAAVAATDADDRPDDLDALAADLNACRANSATLQASLGLIDGIYKANER